MAEEAKEEKIDSLWKRCVTTITYTGVTDPNELPEGITAFEWTFKGMPMKPAKRKKLTLKGLNADSLMLFDMIDRQQGAINSLLTTKEGLPERITKLEGRVDAWKLDAKMLESIHRRLEDLEAVASINALRVVREANKSEWGGATATIKELEEQMNDIGKVVTAIAVQPKPCWWCRLTGRKA